jgi:methionine-rich copper-binding protein CopC
MSTRSKAATILAMALAMCWVLAGIALSHGEIASSDPEADAVLDQIPPEVSVTYTETPADSSKFVVKDGCGDEVGTGVAVKGKALVAQVSDGQPGTWTVTWDVLSAEDGHETHGSISFKVQAKPDCSGGGSPTTSTTDETPKSFPVIVVVVAVIGVLLVALALLVRRSEGRD